MAGDAALDVRWGLRLLESDPQISGDADLRLILQGDNVGSGGESFDAGFLNLNSSEVEAATTVANTVFLSGGKGSRIILNNQVTATKETGSEPTILIASYNATPSDVVLQQNNENGIFSQLVAKGSNYTRIFLADNDPGRILVNASIPAGESVVDQAQFFYHGVDYADPLIRSLLVQLLLLLKQGMEFSITRPMS